jgi:protein-S-isoprenylcysteine O-methyltransferase Ste14
MVGKHIALTLIVGTALAILVLKHPPVSWTVMPLVGVMLLITGFTFWTIARFQLGASFTVTAQARQLVTTGLYSKIRNPIYVFGSMVIAGAFLYFGRPALLLIFVFVIPLQIMRARKEAQVLESQFGDDYRAYRAGTWF